MALPSLAEVLALRPVVEGQPELVAGSGTDGLVRWAHVGETPDLGVMLSGGEVVLTTGRLLADPQVQTDFVDRLARAGVTALMLGMGREFDAVPAALAAACRRHELPLIALWRPIAFVTITEAVQTLCLQRAATRAMLAETVRARLNRLTLDRSPMQALVAELSALAGCPVVVESVDRRVLLSAGSSGLGEVLRDWERLSRAISRDGGAAALHRGPDGVVAARLVRDRATWGRLILFAHAVPADRAEVVAELGAEALSLHQLTHARDSQWEQQASVELFTDLLANTHSAEVLALRARAAGFPVRHATVTPLVVGLDGSGPAPGPMLLERARSAAAWAGVAVLLGPEEAGVATLLCSVQGRADPDAAVDAFARQLRAGLGEAITCIAAGFGATGTGALPRSLLEARRVFASGDRREPVVRLADLHLDGLVRMLADDDALQGFADRELGPLLDSPDLLELLEHFIAHNLNKSETAEAMFLSRPAVYRRLDHIQDRLGVDLGDISSVAALHLALRAWRARGATHPGAPGMIGR